MRSIHALAIIGALLLGTHASAAEQTCKAAATEKKLSGAAKNSSVKKCTREAVGA